MMYKFIIAKRCFFRILIAIEIAPKNLRLIIGTLNEQNIFDTNVITDFLFFIKSFAFFY